MSISFMAMLRPLDLALFNFDSFLLISALWSAFNQFLLCIPKNVNENCSKICFLSRRDYICILKVHVTRQTISLFNAVCTPVLCFSNNAFCLLIRLYDVKIYRIDAERGNLEFCLFQKLCYVGNNSKQLENQPCSVKIENGHLTDKYKI